MNCEPTFFVPFVISTALLALSVINLRKSIKQVNKLQRRLKNELLKHGQES